ncbi:hypothetical protein RCL1_005307 [Eukaryota sp. TZLM3-RCL]
MSALQKIAEIEAEMARTQRNKATNAHIGLLKAKIAKLKREAFIEESVGGKSGGGGRGFEVARSGVGRISLLGFPSVGKSSLMNNLTGSESEVSEIEFTTLTAIPSPFVINGVTFQLLDLPGIISGAKDGKGRGKAVISTARTSDLILIVLDATKAWTDKRIIENELEGFGIRLNKVPPEIKMRKKEKGGITYTSTVPLTKLTEEVINSVCKEYRMNNVDFNFHCDATVDELIDILEGNRVYVPCVYVLNKCDAMSLEELELFDKIPNYVPISVHKNWNIDGLKDAIWDALNITRIYTKKRGCPVDFAEPVALSRRRGPVTVKRFVESIHRGLAGKVSYAWVWGRSVRFQPMKCSVSHVLEDEDIVSFVAKS